MSMGHTSTTFSDVAAGPREPRLLVLAAGLLALGALSGAVYAVDASVGHTGLELPGQDRQVIGRLSPQGWAFFTKDPQDELLRVMERVDGRWQVSDEEPSGSPVNLFGFRRHVRARGVEVGLFTQALGHAQMWHECKGEPESCADSLPVAAVVANPSPSPFYCGELVVFRQKPVPWAWSKAPKPVVMPSFLARIEVQC
jgi:antimicrobial peptide system SdpA family protein